MSSCTSVAVCSISRAAAKETRALGLVVVDAAAEKRQRGAQPLPPAGEHHPEQTGASRSPRLSTARASVLSTAAMSSLTKGNIPAEGMETNLAPPYCDWRDPWPEQPLSVPAGHVRDFAKALAAQLRHPLRHEPQE